MTTRRGAGWVLGLAGIIGIGAPSSARAGDGVKRTIEVQGHRGARAARPENTLAAFEHALAVGVDTLELDVVVTRDDHLAVTHDPLLNPEICLGPDGAPLAKDRHAVRAMSLAELQRYDCGTLRSPRFPGQRPVPGARIPSLEQVFELVRSSKSPAAGRVKLNVELKLVPGRPDLAPSPERFAELAVAVIRRGWPVDRVTLQSFDHRALMAARRLEPKLEVAALTSDNFVDYVAVARSAGASILSPDREWITKDAVAALHAARVRVIPWTANDPESWARLVDADVDGIITDDPEGLIRWLVARGLR